MCSSMKSRMRSRSVSTWGLGVKSIDWSSPRGWAARTLAGMAVAGEELAVLLEEPGELQLRGGGQRLALEDAGGLGPGQLRRRGQEELVDQACRPELAVQV